MIKIVTHTEAQSFEISKLKASLKKTSNPPEITRILIHQNLEHDVIRASNLART